MTTANCIKHSNASNDITRLEIRVGISDLKDEKIESNTYRAKRVVYDSRHDTGRSHEAIGDIALVEVEGTFEQKEI